MSVKRIRPLLFVLSALIFLGSGVWFFSGRFRNVSAISVEPAGGREIRVEVTGAVMQPGTYVLNEDSRVLDAIAAAGGFDHNADPRINLARHLYNEQHLEIPYLNNTSSPVSTETPPVQAQVDESLESASVDMVAIPSPTFTPDGDVCSKPVTGSGVFMWPVQARFLSGFDFSSDHPGIDIAAGMGSPVYAADSGVISMEGNDDSSYGNVIEIDHGNGFSTVYAHLSVIEVQACKSVYAGQRIGLAGKTGNADGAHLHFEVIQDGEYIDPWSVLPEP